MRILLGRHFLFCEEEQKNLRNQEIIILYVKQQIV